MTNTPLSLFLQSNYVQRKIKAATKGDYENYDDATLERMATEAQEAAKNMDDTRLADYLDQSKGLTKLMRQLPYDLFSWATYTIDELVTTLWVSDLPHRVTHGTLRDVLNFARDDVNRQEAPTFFDRVTRIRRLESISSLPTLVVEPSRYQRSNRRKHSPDPDSPSPPPQCEVEYLLEGKAYIEDGNHRAIANLLNTGDEKLSVIRLKLE